MIHYFFWIIRSILHSFLIISSASKNTKVYTTTYTAAIGALPFKGIKKLCIVFHYHGDRVPTRPEQTWSFRHRLTQSIKRWYVIRFHYLSWSYVDLFCIPSIITLNQLKTASYAPRKVLNQKSIVLPNGINLKQFHPVRVKEKQDIQKKFQILKNSFVVGVIGRVDPQKDTLGTITFIQKYMWKTHKNLLVILAAPLHGNDQKYLQQVKELLQRTKLPHRIIIDQTNIEELYQASDVVISHSKQEVFPLSMLESFACGVPFFAIKNGVTESYLTEVDTKLILNPTTNLLQKSFPSFLKSAVLQHKMLSYASKHSWEKSADMFTENLRRNFKLN